MTKDKRQLRAETVERLKAMTVDPTMGFVAVAALDKPVNGREWRDALIDLLTDDEPPEGDALGIMYVVADKSDGHTLYHGITKLMQAICKEPEDRRETGTELAIALRALAGMVERDYVRREEYDEALEIRDEALGDAAMFKAERDEWKAKAERSNDGVKRSMTNLEWLYRANGEFHRIANVFAVGETDEDTDEWLMAGHVDENEAQMPDLREQPETGASEACVKVNRSDAREYVISENLGLSQDSEMLEAEAWDCDASYTSDSDSGNLAAIIISLFDCMAEIVARKGGGG